MRSSPFTASTQSIEFKTAEPYQDRKWSAPKASRSGPERKAPYYSGLRICSSDNEFPTLNGVYVRAGGRWLKSPGAGTWLRFSRGTRRGWVPERKSRSDGAEKEASCVLSEDVINKDEAGARCGVSGLDDGVLNSWGVIRAIRGVSERNIAVLWYSDSFWGKAAKRAWKVCRVITVGFIFVQRKIVGLKAFWNSFHTFFESYSGREPIQ